MTPEQLALAHDSYARCCAVPEFFTTFYELFLESSPEIPPMFAHTQFERQNKLLQHGLGLLLIYAKRRNPALLERIAIRHSRKGIDAKPSFYPNFVDSLIEAVRRHDPKCSSEVEEAWRAAVAPGVEYMTGKY